MATGWIIKRNNKESGPFSPQQLKQLASSGKLKPEDLLRKEPGGKFQRANSIKGLFPEKAAEEDEDDTTDSAEFANIDISRFGDLPMEEDDDDEDDGPPKKRSKSGGASAKSGGRKKKAGSKKGKGKKGKKEVSWQDDPINDLFFGSLMIFIAIGFMFFMDPATYELPDFMVKIHEFSGRFGVGAAVLLGSLIFFIPAFQKIQRLKAKGQSIPWHLPNLMWIFGGLFSSEDSESDEA